MEEAEARGFWPTDDSVCSSHISETFLSSQLEEAESDLACVVCGARESPRVPLDDLMDLIMTAIRSNWGRAADDLYRDPETESGWALVTCFDTRDVVREDLGGDIDDEAVELIADRLEFDEWYDPSQIWLEGHELLKFSWDQFHQWICDSTIAVDAVARWPRPSGWMSNAADGVPPCEMLDQLTDLIGELGLITTTPITNWFRCTELDDGEMVTARRLGTPPTVYAIKPNRMSPAGKPMFYGAADKATALAEIGAATSIKRIATGVWKASRPVRVLDLTKHPDLPSYFDVERDRIRQGLIFLRHFTDDVSRKLEPPAVLRIEYRPTQAVMHQLQVAFPAIDGIVFASSHTGQPNCALFVKNEVCIEADELSEWSGGLAMVLVSSELS